MSEAARRRRRPRGACATCRPRSVRASGWPGCGPAALSNRELLALLVGSGSRAALRRSTWPRTCWAAGLRGLAGRSLAELERERGVGRAKATRLLAALELGARLASEGRGPRRPCFRTPEDAARYLLPRYGARPVETFGLLALDVRHRLKREAVISVGCLTSSLVHPREVFQEAVVARAAALVLFHNHPSGDPEPSAEDLSLTRRLASRGHAHGHRGPRPPDPGRRAVREPEGAGRAVSRIVYFDCASGASGDMLLGALVDLGLPLDALRAELAKLPLEGYHLEARKVHRSGLQATKVDVLVADGRHEHAHTAIRPSRAPAAARHPRASSSAARLDAAREGARGGALPPAGRGRGRGPRHVARGRSTSTRWAPWTRSSTSWAAWSGWAGWAPSASWPRRSTWARARSRCRTASSRCRLPPPRGWCRACPVYGAGEGELLTPTGALLVTGHADRLRPAAAAAARGGRPRRGHARHRRAGPTCCA